MGAVFPGGVGLDRWYHQNEDRCRAEVERIAAGAKDLPATVKTIATDVGSLPRRVVAKLPVGKDKKEKLYRTLGQIEALLHELLFPSAPDNEDSEIAL